MALNLESFVMKNTMSIQTIKTQHMALNLESFVMKNTMSTPAIITQRNVMGLRTSRVNHNPSNRRFQKATSSVCTFSLEMFGGRTSVLDGL